MTLRSGVRDLPGVADQAQSSLERLLALTESLSFHCCLLPQIRSRRSADHFSVKPAHLSMQYKGFDRHSTCIVFTPTLWRLPCWRLSLAALPLACYAIASFALFDVHISTSVILQETVSVSHLTKCQVTAA